MAQMKLELVNFDYIDWAMSCVAVNCLLLYFQVRAPIK